MESRQQLSNMQTKHPADSDMIETMRNVLSESEKLVVECDDEVYTPEQLANLDY